MRPIYRMVSIRAATDTRRSRLGFGPRQPAWAYSITCPCRNQRGQDAPTHDSGDDLVGESDLLNQFRDALGRSDARGSDPYIREPCKRRSP